jgi:hypothetical protein
LIRRAASALERNPEKWKPVFRQIARKLRNLTRSEWRDGFPQPLAGDAGRIVFY